MDVGTATMAFAGTAFVIAALSELFLRRWLISAILGVVGGQAVFLWWFGFPSAAEMVFPLLFSVVPALLGATVPAVIMKIRGRS